MIVCFSRNKDQKSSSITIKNKHSFDVIRETKNHNYGKLLGIIYNSSKVD